MLRRINAASCFFAAVVLAGSAVAQTAAPASQPVAPPHPFAPAAIQAGAADPTPPAPAEAMKFYQAVDSWVRRWQTPMDPMGQAPLPAAAVTLRFDGSIVGRGVAIASQPEGAPGILMMATSRALNEARDRLPVEHDALMDESLKAAAARVAITVELAGRLIPIQPDQYADAVSLVAPGLEGVAVRTGDTYAAMFPETMLATGTDAAAAIRALAAKASGDPALGLKEPKELREKNGAAFYKFKVTVVGQAAAGKPPEYFQRGGRVAQLTGLSEEGLRIWADKLAEHLWYQRWPGKEAFGVQGVYDPMLAVNESSSSGPAVQGVVALAMWNYATMVEHHAQVNGRDARNSTVKWVLNLLREADRVEPGETAPWHDPAAAAMMWYVLDEARVAPWKVPLPAWSGTAGEQTDAALVDLKKHCADTLDTVVVPGAVSDPAVSAVVAWGLRQRFRSFPDPMAADERLGWTPEAKNAAETFVSSEFSRVDPNRLASTLPWLGWADVTRGSTKRGQAASAWREMRSQLWQHQLQATDLSTEDRDLAGGIVFSTNRQPLPTWQAARPLAFVATMLGDPRLTDEKELASETVRLIEALRYLRQLTAEEAEAHMYKDPARAIGGVRSSVFDQRMPPEATAMTLLTVCETIKSLDAIKARQAAAAPK